MRRNCLEFGCITNATQILEQIDVDEDNLLIDVAALSIFFVGFRIIGCYALKLRISYGR